MAAAAVRAGAGAALVEEFTVAERAQRGPRLADASPAPAESPSLALAPSPDLTPSTTQKSSGLFGRLFSRKPLRDEPVVDDDHDASPAGGALAL